MTENMKRRTLPEFVKPGAVVRAKDVDITVQGTVGQITDAGSVLTPGGAYIGDELSEDWTLVTPAPKTFDEKVADLLSVRIGKTFFTAGDAAVLRLLEDVDKAGLKLVEK